MVIGTVSVLLLRSLDRKYTDLINRTVPALSNLQVSSFDALATFRSIGPSVLLNAPPEKRPELLLASEKILARQKKNFAELLSSPPFAPTATLRARIEPSATKFVQGMEAFIRLYREGRIAEATAFREATLRADFDSYITAITVTVDAVEADGMKDSDSMTETMTWFSKIMIALAGWPLLVIGTLILLTGLFFGMLMIAFRSKEAQ